MTCPETAWFDDKLVAVDFETSGADVYRDRIVTAAVVHIRRGARPRSFGWVIDPGIEVPEQATQVHGWTTDRLRAHPSVMAPAQALFEITGMLAYPLGHGIPLVAFNAAFDLTILEAENRRHDQPTLIKRLAPKPVAPVCDPFVIDKATSRRQGSRRLDDQCRFHRVTLAGAHTADADAIAAARLLVALLRKHPHLGNLTARELHERQVIWRAEQQDSLRRYFEAKQIEHDGCPPGWPIQAAPVASQGVLA